MNPVHHVSNNMLLGPPTGVSDDDCLTLPATMLIDGTQVPPHYTIQSYWKPTHEELAKLNANGTVILSVIGQQHPMVWVHTE